MKCLYCGNLIIKKSNEHIILSSLGGKKKSKNICCGKCNGDLGNLLDKDIADQLNFFSNQINLVTGRGKPAPVLKNLDSGKGYKVDILPGGKPFLSEPKIEITDSNGMRTLSIQARTVAEAKKLIEDNITRLGLKLEDIQDMDATLYSEYTKPIDFNLSIGGPIHFRSIAKMMLNYFGTKVDPDRIRNGQFDKIISYITIGKDFPDNRINHDYFSEFPLTPFHGDFTHRLFVFSNKDEKIVYGLLELFNHIRFSCILTDIWDGPNIGHVYIVNPVLHKSYESKSDLPKTITKSSLLNRTIDLNLFLDAQNKLFRTINSVQKRNIIEGITRDTGKNIFGKEGELITQEMLTTFIKEVSEKFVQSMFRIDSNKTIKIKDLFKNNI
jgi:hypothetical protein